MSKFNTGSTTASRTARATSPVKSKHDEPTLVTGNGAPAWERKPKGELFLLAVSNMVGEKSFYEAAGDRDERFRELVRKVSAKDPAWMARFIPWLRNEAYMRTASIVAAVEFAQVHKSKPHDELTARTVVASALQRADEPGETVAYVRARGYALSKPLKRGIADAVTRLYTERNVLKYDGESHDWRFGDVLEVTHASPRAEWQGDLFQYVISRRHKRPDLTIPESLQMLRTRSTLDAYPLGARRAVLDSPEILASAGVTWESLSGWLQGPMDAAAWEAIIPSMGYMALLRNLRNFDQAKVSDAVARTIADKLSDPAEVARSRQFPFRFLAAYRAAGNSLRWSWALEQALNASLANVPSLGGHTLVLVDRSPSMWQQTMSKHSDMTWADGAAVFGAALALRASSADLVEFGAGSRPVAFNKTDSVLKLVDRFGRDSGTDIPAAIKLHLRPEHTRVVVVTDEQTSPGVLPSNVGGYTFAQLGWTPNYPRESYLCMRSTSVNDLVPANVPFYVWNWGGYRAGATPSGEANRHTMGGLTDSAFKVIPLLEAGRDGGWPF